MGERGAFNRAALKSELDAFCVSEKYGFLLEDPLTNLPEYYQEWMEVASNVTELISSHQLGFRVRKMPLLSPYLLRSHRELRLAHLALAVITAGYVWQEGQKAPSETLPKVLALPLWLVSRRLGLPAILTYADLVLCNWKLKNPAGDMEIGNMDPIFSLPGGESSTGFVLVSSLVEMAASSGIKGALDVKNAMATEDLQGIQRGLLKVALSLEKMKETFKLMHKHVDPSSFFGTLRTFFTGWRDNPMLPDGLLYEGVSREPIKLSGSSAGQSSAIQCFDALLSIQHDEDADTYLVHLRDYMPPDHHQLINALCLNPSLRDYVHSCANLALCQAYNSCVSALEDLRTYHFSIVVKYITIPSKQGRGTGCPFGGSAEQPQVLGTSGSDPLVFLKSARDATHRALILGMDPKV